jgi:hypothetical protein
MVNDTVWAEVKVESGNRKSENKKMRSRKTAIPFGLDAETKTFRALCSRVFNELNFFDSTTITVAQKTRGISFNVRPRPSPSPGGAAVGNYTGEYDPTRSYNPQQICIISMGSNSGTFVCIQASTGNAPYAGGGYWVQLPMGQLGVWM